VGARRSEYATYKRLEMVESATEAAPFKAGDLTSIAPPLI
jgi:hypothetical protein